MERGIFKLLINMKDSTLYAITITVIFIYACESKYTLKSISFQIWLLINYIIDKIKGK
jgi:hypothetical protein